MLQCVVIVRAVVCRQSANVHAARGIVVVVLFFMRSWSKRAIEGERVLS